MFDFNWFDYSLIVLAGIIAGLFARRKLAGFVVGLAALIFIQPLLRMAQMNPWLAIVAAAILGFLVLFLGQYLNERDSIAPNLQSLLGGIGGVIFGISMLFAIAISFPIDTPNGQIMYPSDLGRSRIAFTVEDSQLVNIGRDILFYDLYLSSNQRHLINSANPNFVGAMHGYLVAGEPWN